MNADEVGFLKNPIEILGYFDAGFLRVGRCGKRIVAQDFHVETLCHLRDSHPDSAQTYQAEDLTVQLVAHVFLSVPCTALEAVAGRDNIAAHSQYQGYRMLGGAEGVPAGGVHDYYTLSGGFRDVDVVDSDASPGYRLELAGVGQDFGRYRGGASDDQAIVLADDASQLVLVDPDFDNCLHTVHGIEQINPFLCEFVRDKHFYHCMSPKVFLFFDFQNVYCSDRCRNCKRRYVRHL